MRIPPIVFEHPMESGLVSVVIPSFNRARIVGGAIESALRQTYRHLEVVVADDGSTDDTRNVVARYGPRVRYVHQPNRGVAAARNFAIRHTRGEFVAFLDSDDRWKDWKIAAQIAALTKHTEAGLVCTDMSAIGPDGELLHARYMRMLYPMHRSVAIQHALPSMGTLGELLPSAPAEFAQAAVRCGNLSSQILLGNLLHTSTILLRRRWISQAGGMVIELREGGEDYEYYTRICAMGNVVMLDAPSIEYRIGAADQLSAPARMLSIARNDLNTLRARLADPMRRHSLPSAQIRHRLAFSLEWIGNLEFDECRRGVAARYLAESLKVKPAIDRRVVRLLACALPVFVVDGVLGFRRRRRQSLTANA